VTEECAIHYVFTLDEDCLPYHVDLANQLASRRLAVYARLEPTNILPADYEPADWLVVETDTAWGSVHARDWVLGGVPPDNIVFVFPADEEAFQEMPHPPEDWLDSLSELVGEQLMNRVDGTGHVWVIHPNQTPPLDAVNAALLNSGYAQVDTLSGEWVISRYERPR
jgi:hypothetical protein